DGDCPCCKQRRFEYLDGKAGSRSTSLCGRDAVQLSQKQEGQTMNFADLAARLARHGEVKVNEFMLRAELRDSDKLYELTLFPDGRAIIKGTSDESIARSVFAKYVGA
ncbi:MAG: hypothetical protein KJN72_03710, partial [Woeseia sp.]|nr:hypothetical protein [Woeseia sp.]